MAYLPSDLSNHISEIHAFKPVKNEKSRSSECDCRMLSVVCISDSCTKGGPAYGKQKLQGYYIQNALFRSEESAFAL